MSEEETHDWLESNQRYLSEALIWLRLRLERLAQSEHLQMVAVEPPQKHGLLGGGRHPVEQAADASMLNEQIAQHARALSVAETQEQVPALIRLSNLLSLSRFEREVLLLCIAMEMDTRIAALCAHAQDNANRPYPTFALALALFDEPRWDIVSPERPLRYWRLIEINQPSLQPLITSALRADERIVNYCKGLNYLDDRLAMLTTPLEAHEEEDSLPPSQKILARNIMHYWERAESPLPLIQLVGADALSKQLIAHHAATHLRGHLYRIPVELLSTQPADLETLARLWQRESLLLSLVLYLDAQGLDGGRAIEGQVHPLNRFLARNEGLFFLGTRETWAQVGRPYLTLDVDKPTAAEQGTAWKDALGDLARHNPERLAGQFNLNLPTIKHIAGEALNDDNDDENNKDERLADRLWDACRHVSRPRLDTLAQRLDLKAAWHDLVLPPEETHTLHQLADQVGQRHKVYEDWGFAEKMNRGMGINALFAGESGTGKTMAAEVIAHELRLSLYRIDLSAVVSKYIGETEKNLRRLFDAAEYGGAILFFDEADALFGKRSEVKDSHDRYANIEINYLLQRIESYRGLSILATNMKSALDTAFVRRLRFTVNFPFPGPTERKKMWQRVFPHKTPQDTLDYDRLARLNLVGGSIHNVALNAAFMAAQADTNVNMALIFEAARTEFRKLDRSVNEADFKLPAIQEAQA